MARGRGGGSSPKKPRKGAVYTKSALLDLSRPGARFLLISDIPHVIGKETEPRRLTLATYEDMLEKKYITQPEELGIGVAECYITDLGKKRVAAWIEEKTGFTQLKFKGLVIDEEEEREEIYV